jgi:hypothetical protein
VRHRRLLNSLIKRHRGIETDQKALKEEATLLKFGASDLFTEVYVGGVRKVIYNCYADIFKAITRAPYHAAVRASKISHRRLITALAAARPSATSLASVPAPATDWYDFLFAAMKKRLTVEIKTACSIKAGSTLQTWGKDLDRTRRMLTTHLGLVQGVVLSEWAEGSPTFLLLMEFLTRTPSAPLATDTSATAEGERTKRAKHCRYVYFLGACFLHKWNPKMSVRALAFCLFSGLY